MKRFVAPQFIDVEDKIIGPITTRQFIFMIIGGVIVFVSYKIFDVAAFGLITLVTLGFVVLFGFVKINGRHFHKFAGSMIEALRRPKVRVWYKRINSSDLAKQDKEQEQDKVKTDFSPRKRVKTKKLKDLALMVDTGGKYQG